MAADSDTSEDEQTALERAIRAKYESLRPSFEAWAEDSGEPLWVFDDIVRGQVEYARVMYQKDRAEEELESSSVIWDRISTEKANSLQALLDTNPNEEAVHHFLDDNPEFLIQVLGGGHGRYQISKERLGSEYVPDFLVAEMSSIGIEWYGVELESPRLKAHRNDGLPTQGLNHAIGQVRDWRAWLLNNVDYARRPREQHGLGLLGIDSRVPGLILIGRRQDYPQRFNEYRRQMNHQEQVLIHSYDWLLEVARSNTSGWLGVAFRLDT